MFLERCMWLCLIGMCLNQYSTSGASGQYSTKSAYEAFFVGATLGKNLEELGTWQVQILHVDGSTQKMLDSWTPCKKGTSPPCTLSSLWSGWRNFRPPFGLLCFFPSVLVQLAAGPWTASTCPRFGWWDLRWLVGQFEQQGVLSDQKRSQLSSHFGSLESVESPKHVCFWWGCSWPEQHPVNHQGGSAALVYRWV